MKFSVNGKNTANIITGFRIVCSVLLLFVPCYSGMFWAMYLIAGFSDMLDGMIARKMNIVSEFGAKLDTVADIVFVGACFITILPRMEIPLFLLVWTGIIAVIKMINIVSGYLYRGEFVGVHSVLNKITGVSLFVLPMSVFMLDLRYSGSIVCMIATIAAIQEGHRIRTEE